MKNHILVLSTLILVVLSGCNSKNDIEHFNLHISYSVNGRDLHCDSLEYTNEAGNQFLISEIQWFISSIEFKDDKGQWHHFREDDNIIYFDTDIPESHHQASQSLPDGHYTALRFTFGLDEVDNITGRFPNPPESEMFWPEMLGGGYHYMKLNGKHLLEDGNLAPLNIHLGTGQNNEFTEFYPNHFSVELPIDAILSSSSGPQDIHLMMVVDNWFRNPNLYDFNVNGTAIMQNQAAQQMLKENGQDVFVVTIGSLRSISSVLNYLASLR